MQHAEIRTASPSRSALWTGRTLSGLSVLFLAVDALMKVAMMPPVVAACAELEVPLGVVPGLGVVLFAATVLYAIPATAVLGAVVLTGYLGGATWTHVRMGGPAFPVIFPSLVAAFVWGGLLLREPRLRALCPLRRCRETPPAPDPA